MGMAMVTCFGVQMDTWEVLDDSCTYSSSVVDVFALLQSSLDAFKSTITRLNGIGARCTPEHVQVRQNDSNIV